MMDNSYKFVVKKLNWERIFLNFIIETTYMGSIKFALKNNITKELIKLNWSTEYILDNESTKKYNFCINMAAVNENNFLENGQWEIIAFKSGNSNDFIYSQISKELIDGFDELSRTFRYGKENTYAYTVTFTIQNKKNGMVSLVINSFFMKKNNSWKKSKYIEEVSSLKTKGKMFLKTINTKLIQFAYSTFSLFNKYDGKNILLMSETKTKISSNLENIEKTFIALGLKESYRLSYSFRDTAAKRQSIISWIAFIKLIAKQDIIFVDDYVPVFDYLTPHKKTKLIQVWHAGIGFKAAGYCRFGKQGAPYPYQSCHRKYWKVIGNSNELIKVFGEVFGVNKEKFIPISMPRLDTYLDEKVIANTKTKLLSKYCFLNGKKVILFAPTFRGTGQKSAYYDFNKINLKEIYDVCGEEYVFLIKMHPFIRERFNIDDSLKDRIFDFSSYSDINELYYICDLLITDYSSSFYEFSLLRKPMIFYIYDYEDYKISRGVHRDIYDVAPGKVCESFESLVESIRKEDFEYYKIEKFLEKNFSQIEKNNSEKLLKYVLKLN